LAKRFGWVGLLALVLVLVIGGFIYRWNSRGPANEPQTTTADVPNFTDTMMNQQGVSITLSPLFATVAPGGSQNFVADVSGTDIPDVYWTLAEGDRGGRLVSGGSMGGGGRVSQLVVYIAPPRNGSYHLKVTSKADFSKTATAEIQVTPFAAKPESMEAKKAASTPTSTAPASVPVADLVKQGDKFMSDGNFGEAFQAYFSAAEAGNAHAQYEVGELYFWGRGIRKNNDSALQWYQKAAAQGNADAAQALGTMYQDGLGVPKDLRQAKYWFDKAKQGGRKK
jgi:hypothetical protein